MKKHYSQKKPKQHQIYTMLDEFLASSVEPMPKPKQVSQLSRMYSGLRAMETAENPSTDDWRVCSDAVNLLETLVLEMKVCEDGSGLLNDAIAALAMAGKRHMDGGNIRLDAPGILAVRAVLSDYSELISILPYRTMIQCHRLTERRLKDILNGKRMTHDIEVIAI
jgi:hypothetical protein